jgi:hypothetical protein
MFYQQSLHPLTLCRCTAGLHFSYSLVMVPRLVLLILPLVADSGKPGIVYCRSGTMEGLASHDTRQRMSVSLCWGKFFHKSHCQQTCHCLQLLLLLLRDLFFTRDVSFGGGCRYVVENNVLLAALHSCLQVCSSLSDTCLLPLSFFAPTR